MKGWLDDGDPYWSSQAPERNHGEGGGLFATLSHDDLQRLRRVIRKVHHEHFQGRVQISNWECDRIIETIGMETAEKLIARSGPKAGRVVA